MSLSIKSTAKLNSGHAIPILGLGVALSKDTVATVATGLSCGYRHIDTARHYNNEVDVAKALRQSKIDRRDIFITTKVMSSEHGYEACTKAVKNSLERCEFDYFDLVLLHDPKAGKEKRLEAYRGLEDLRQDGKIKSIGVSNHGIQHLEQILDAGLPAPSVNQIELHPWCQQKEIVRYCKDHDIVVSAFCPLVRSKKMNDPTLVKVSEKVDRTPAQVLVRWSLQHGFVPLPKSDSPDRIKANADVFEFSLDEEDMAALDALDEGGKGSVSWNPVDVA